MDDPLDECCAECGRSRREGWLLIAGRCRICAPHIFQKRIDAMKAKLKGLLVNVESE